MIRSLALALLFAVPAAALAHPLASPDHAPDSKPAVPQPAPISGVVADPTGAIVPNADIELLDATGAVAGLFHSGADGSFQVQPPHAGSFTLVVSEPGFESARMPIVAAAPVPAANARSHPFTAPLHIVLPIAALSTNVHVSAENNEDLTDSASNHDASVMTANDLKALPIFDNDYATAMSIFEDSSATMTGGAGLMVDGVESDRSTVSASAVQEVRINQDPYSAQYYWPGRGQMEIITKSAADHYHGAFNFFFRDNSMNAQNALAPNKPYEQRRVYEGYATGPIFFAPKSSFLASFNRAEEDSNAVIDATVVPTSQYPNGKLTENVPTPYRDTEFSARVAHQFAEGNSAYVQYSHQDTSSQNQGIGGQTTADAAYNSNYHDDYIIAHADSTLSPELLNQFSTIGVLSYTRNTNTVEAQAVNVSGDFAGGSAQNDTYATNYNFRLFDMISWTRGRHYIKAGIGIPNFARRAFDDNTNSLGSYTYGPTVAADGTVLASALDNYKSHQPSGFSQNYGDVHFIYHQQEMGAFIQDQIKINDRFSITPGIRYDWLNFLAQKRLGFAPRLSFAYVLDEKSKTVLRGGGGLYYDRFGSGPLLDMVRYEGVQPRRRSVTVSLNPADPPCGPGAGTETDPNTDCVDVSTLPVNRVELAPNARLPYQMQYGLSIERQIGEKSTATISAYSMREIGLFRSVDVNAPTPESGYTERPDSKYLRIRQMQPEGFLEGDGMDISYEGRLNKYFTGFGRYTWSHYASNSGGINWYPQNQYAPNDEWADASWDRRNRLGFYGIFNQKSLFNLSGGIFANSGTPWTITTGTDPYGDDLFNARPDGVAPYTEELPPYVDMDLRWGHDFALTPNKSDEAPHLGFSAASYNVLNHPNVSGVDTVETSPTFGETTAVNPPRRVQLSMRFEF